jgi:manganese transport protein
MVWEQASDYFNTEDDIFWKVTILVSAIAFVALLIIAIVWPLLKRNIKDPSVELHKESPLTVGEIVVPVYKRIAVALDFSSRDQQLLAFAIGQANKETTFIVIHIVESASARVLGHDADDFESRDDQKKLDRYVMFLNEKGFMAESRLGFKNRHKEIPRLTKEAEAELLVIGAHGHSGIKDWLYGATIDAVRHQLKIPVLIVNS